MFNFIFKSRIFINCVLKLLFFQITSFKLMYINREADRPRRPMNIVSMREATGSAAKVRTAGIAIDKISLPRVSNLQTNLQLHSQKRTPSLRLEMFIITLWFYFYLDHLIDEPVPISH